MRPSVPVLPWQPALHRKGYRPEDPAISGQMWYTAQVLEAVPEPHPVLLVILFVIYKILFHATVQTTLSTTRSARYH
jgi:hypothetical protein